MGRKKQKFKFEDSEEEEGGEATKQSNSTSAAGGGGGGDDDEEANEDLSLKIVEKALSRLASKVAKEDAKGRSGNANTSWSSSPDSDPVVAVIEIGKKRKNKKKNNKKMTTDRTVAAVNEEAEWVLVDNDADGEEVKAGGVDSDAANGEAKERTVDGEAVDAEGKVGTIENNDVLRKLLRGPRYFDPPDSGWSTCYYCGEEGHMAINCASAKKKKRPCFVCGGLDHDAKVCTKGKECYICKKEGHRAKDCPQKHDGSLKHSKMCLRCGSSGHDMFTCRMNYSADDLKEIQCYICKRFGHLCCFNPVENSPKQVSCYRCGELGHNGLVCSMVHDEDTIKASPSSCYKCGGEGHFARECTSSTKIRKRSREESTPFLKDRAENKKRSVSKSAPNNPNKSRRKKMTEERDTASHRKSKYRVGWVTEDPEEDDFTIPKRKKNSHHWNPQATPSYKRERSSNFIHEGHISDSRSPKRMQKNKNKSGSKSVPYDLGKAQKAKHRGVWNMDDPGNASTPKRKKDLFASPSTPSYHYKGTRIFNPTPYENSHIPSSQPPRWNHSYYSRNSAFQQPGTPFRDRFSASRFGNSGSAGIRRDYDWW